jgi:hypothetical protein
MPTDREKELEEQVRLLIQAIERYTDNPGCNIPARKTAITKLLWSAEQAKKVL